MWCKRGTRRVFPTGGWGQRIELVVAPNWLCWITRANLLVEWGRRRGRWIRGYKFLDRCEGHNHLVRFMHPLHQGRSAQRHFMYSRGRWETDSFMNPAPVRETRFIHRSRCSAVGGFADENCWCCNHLLFAPLVPFVLWDHPRSASRCFFSRMTVRANDNLRPYPDDDAGWTHHGLFMRC